MTPSDYMRLKRRVIAAGYEDDVAWAESIRPCGAPCHFLREYIFVLVNSGMKEQVARKIFWNILEALGEGWPAHLVFGHRGKTDAIDRGVREALQWWDGYQAVSDKLAYLKGLPWIGDITKYHLAKNLGWPVAKPDRHLARLAGGVGKVQAMCEELAAETGDSVTVVDTVIWRAANLGMV